MFHLCQIKITVKYLVTDLLYFQIILYTQGGVILVRQCAAAVTHSQSKPDYLPFSPTWLINSADQSKQKVL